MNKEKLEEIKKKMVTDLRAGIEDSLLENFVEKYEDWTMKLKSVNDVLNHTDPNIQPYDYNEFCKKIIEITKISLEEGVDYEKLFLTGSEYSKIMKENSGDEAKAEQAMLEELNKKFMDNLMLVLSKDHLKESIRYKLKDKFHLVESELDKSLELARVALKKRNKQTL
jgi:hypothetical protein